VNMRKDVFNGGLNRMDYGSNHYPIPRKIFINHAEVKEVEEK
jgi:hypothetical protein